MRMLTFALVVGCRQWPSYTGAFDVPSALGVIHPENGAPFDEPIGFVGNEHGGQIAMLALKQGRFLTDSGAVAYLRGNQLATGQRRLLAGLFPYVHSDGRVTVFAADKFYKQVVEIPWVVGFDGEVPQQRATTVSEVSGSSGASLDDLTIKTGWTATEDWSVVFDGTGWNVTGSRSGPMQVQAIPGEPFVGVDRAVAFTMNGTAAPGDRFDFSTDAGAIEHETPGTPLQFRPAPDGSIAAMVVHPEGQPDALVHLFDPERPQDLATGAALVLPEAQPARLAWSETGLRLFVSDSARPVVWEVVWLDANDRTAYDVVIHRVPWPTFDIAPLQGDEDLLYLAPLDGTSYWLLDLDGDVLRDLNPWVPGVQGMRMDGALNGLEAMPIDYLQLERNNDGARRRGRSVAVSLASGAVVFAQEGTGCLVDDGSGPRSAVQGTVGITRDYTRDFEDQSPAGAFMELSGNSDRHILGNPCAGITRAQNWVLRYRELDQAWQVIGSLSGEQESMALEDRRYISDDGEISFLIRSGGSPSQDGWSMSLRMVDGITNANGDNDGVLTTREVSLNHPSDPLFFHYRVGPDDQGWRPIDDRPFVLVAGESSDRVGRVMPNEGLIDASWD